MNVNPSLLDLAYFHTGFLHLPNGCIIIMVLTKKEVIAQVIELKTGHGTKEIGELLNAPSLKSRNTWHNFRDGRDLETPSLCLRKLPRVLC